MGFIFSPSPDKALDRRVVFSPTKLNYFSSDLSDFAFRNRTKDSQKDKKKKKERKI